MSGAAASARVGPAIRLSLEEEDDRPTTGPDRHQRVRARRAIHADRRDRDGDHRARCRRPPRDPLSAPPGQSPAKGDASPHSVTPTTDQPTRSSPEPLEELRARLLDAKGRDVEIELRPGIAEELEDRQLLWVDVARRDQDAIEELARDLSLPQEFVALVRDSEARAAVSRRPGLIRLRIVTLESTDGTLEKRPVDIIAGKNLVVTIHDGPLEAFDPLHRELEGETRLGQLDAANFVDIVVDSCIDGWFRELETIERNIDSLDDLALRSRTPASQVLTELVRMRRRVAVVRRTLTPHRAAFGPLARPDFELHEELGQPWPGLNDRLERAIEGAENLRETLLGSFDIYMGRAAQHANDVMKTLTIVSAMTLPAVVLAGVMGMNFDLPFFGQSNNFWLVVLAMIAFAIGLVVVSRWRGWI